MEYNSGFHTAQSCPIRRPPTTHCPIHRCRSSSSFSLSFLSKQIKNPLPIATSLQPETFLQLPYPFPLKGHSDSPVTFFLPTLGVRVDLITQRSQPCHLPNLEVVASAAPLEVFLKVLPKNNWMRSRLSMLVLHRLAINLVLLALVEAVSTRVKAVVLHLAAVVGTRRSLLDLAVVLDMEAVCLTASDQARPPQLRRPQQHERPSRAILEVGSMSPRLDGPIWTALVLLPWQHSLSAPSTLHRPLPSLAAEARLEAQS